MSALSVCGIAGAPLPAFALDAVKPDMIVHRGTPLNAEPRPDRLRAAFITAQKDFYIRCHGTIPRLATDGFKLKVGGQGSKAAAELTLDELRARFPRRAVTSIMQCAGNRRADMAAVKHVSGDAWGPGAISNAEWTGIGLGDVLKAAGIKEDATVH